MSYKIAKYTTQKEYKTYVCNVTKLTFFHMYNYAVGVITLLMGKNNFWKWRSWPYFLLYLSELISVTIISINDYLSGKNGNLCVWYLWQVGSFISVYVFVLLPRLVIWWNNWCLLGRWRVIAVILMLYVVVHISYIASYIVNFMTAVLISCMTTD